MKYLLFISIFSLLFMCCCPCKKISNNEKIDTIPFWTSQLMDSVKKNDFRIKLSTPKSIITGIYLVKQVNGEWKGTIINEFGLKVTDFVSNPQKCKLMNVISFLDKWHIKKILASDIQFMMEIDSPLYNIASRSNRYWIDNTLIVNYKKKKEIQRFPNGEIILNNHKHKICYSFKKIYEIEE